MAVTTTAAALIPPRPSLGKLREAAAGCRACPLWKRGTQTVFGEGPRAAQLVLVGEQPGNDEDLAGHPFVGPAGRLLDGVLQEAGIDRSQAYVTNVVKHFKWERRGKRRIHERPNGSEIRACLPWLMAELNLLKPRALVLLGATPAQALLGPGFRVTRERGKPVPSDLAPVVMATVHPSSVLRAPTDEDRHAQQRRLVQDFRRLAAAMRTDAVRGG
jgi:DNA polymerase